jgi:hypothetical protein
MVNLFSYKCSLVQGEYVAIRLNQVDSLEEMLEKFNCVDIAKEMFAVFKEGIVPEHECRKNKYKLTCALNGENMDHIEFLTTCWNKNIFEIKGVNGIYVNSQKASVWLNEELRNIKALNKYKFNFVIIKHEADIATLDRSWTFKYKYIDKVNGRDRYITTNSEEKIVRSINNFYNLKGDGNGVFLSSNILNEKEWRVKNQNNRFVFSRIIVGLERSNQILRKFALTVLLALYPKFPNIYSGFCYYNNGELQLGIYVSGIKRFIIDNDYIADEAAMIIGHKFKQIVLEESGPESNAIVTVTNAIPSPDSDFTNQRYEYRTNIRI